MRKLCSQDAPMKLIGHRRLELFQPCFYGMDFSKRLLSLLGLLNTALQLKPYNQIKDYYPKIQSNFVSPKKI